MGLRQRIVTFCCLDTGATMALIERCPVHKWRNVADQLREEHKSAVKKKLQNACAMTEYTDARRALERLHR